MNFKIISGLVEREPFGYWVLQGVPLLMDETYLRCPGSGSADVLVREEPDEEEEDEKEHDGDEEDDDGDEGYSE
jgi:hypothetical protein